MLQQIDQTMSDSGILLQSIQFFPNEKSTVWGIYWEDVLFAWRFLKQIQELDVFSYCWGQDLWPSVDASEGSAGLDPQYIYVREHTII